MRGQIHDCRGPSQVAAAENVRLDYSSLNMVLKIELNEEGESVHRSMDKIGGRIGG